MNKKLFPYHSSRRTYLQTAAVLGLSPLSNIAFPKQLFSRNHLTASITLEPDVLDPTYSHAASAGQVVHLNILEGLTKIDESGHPQPLLAQSWQISADRKSYRFELRTNARFHDGAPLTADTVLFSFLRAQQAGKKNKAHGAVFSNIAHMQASAAHTLLIQLHRPDPYFLFRLGESTAVILHPHTAKQTAQHPIGTGPYRFIAWQRARSVHMRRFEDYHSPDSRTLEYAVFRFIPTLPEQTQAMERGEIDVAFNFIAHDLHRLQSDARYQVLIGSTSSKGLLAINHRVPVLQDLRVRQALTHAIDKQAFIDRVMEGKSTAIGSHFTPTDPGFLNLANTHSYNPTQAKRLLREAGITQPLALTLTVLPVPYARAGAPVIAEYLAQVGIQLEIQPVTWAEWQAHTFKGAFELSLITHVEPFDHLIYQDPDYYFGYDSPAFRALVARHSASNNPRERQQLFADLQRHLATDAASVWLFSPQLCTVARKGLQGLRMNHPILAHDLSAMHWA